MFMLIVILAMSHILRLIGSGTTWGAGSTLRQRIRPIDWFDLKVERRTPRSAVSREILIDCSR